MGGEGSPIYIRWCMVYWMFYIKSSWCDRHIQLNDLSTGHECGLRCLTYIQRPIQAFLGLLIPLCISFSSALIQQARSVNLMAIQWYASNNYICVYRELVKKAIGQLSCKLWIITNSELTVSSEMVFCIIITHVFERSILISTPECATSQQAVKCWVLIAPHVGNIPTHGLRLDFTSINISHFTCRGL